MTRCRQRIRRGASHIDPCYSAFNAESASSVTSDGTGDGEGVSGAGYRPPLGGFYLEEGTLYRWRDTDDSGSLTDADRKDVLVDHIVNSEDGTPLFVYTCINTGNGEAPYGVPLGARYTTSSPGDLATVISVEITLRVDLNYGHSPTYMSLFPLRNRATTDRRRGRGWPSRGSENPVHP